MSSSERIQLKIVTMNPTTGKKIREYDSADKNDVDRTVARARRAFEDWRLLNPSERGNRLYDSARVLRSHDRALAEIMTEEMGKPIKESVAEVQKSAWGFEFYAQHTEEFLKPERVETDAAVSYVAFEPLGVVASIMPWNFPMWQLARFAAPALAGGNTTVFKPSSVSPETGLKLQQALDDAGLPSGCFTTLVGDRHLGTMLIEAETDAVSFTGSVTAGAQVAELAAKNLKKFVLELGGSDPFIVLDDADVDVAAAAAVTGRFRNCGQSCISAKRFLVDETVAKSFIEKFVAQTSKLKVGDPASEQTDVGPMVREEVLLELDRQVKESIAQGAKALLGGRRMGREGFFYEPTILVDVKPKMPVMLEETFGPVAPIMSVRDEAEAVAVANATEFGLGASIWTSNPERGEELTKHIRAGVVTVNNIVASDPRVPFGGVKKSGIGRELSRYGLLEFMNIKTIRAYKKTPTSTIRVE